MSEIQADLKRKLLTNVIEELCLNYLAIDPELVKLAKKVDDQELQEIIDSVVRSILDYEDKKRFSRTEQKNISRLYKADK